MIDLHCFYLQQLHCSHSVNVSVRLCCCRKLSQYSLPWCFLIERNSARHCLALPNTRIEVGRKIIVKELHGTATSSARGRRRLLFSMRLRLPGWWGLSVTIWQRKSLYPSPYCGFSPYHKWPGRWAVKLRVTCNVLRYTLTTLHEVFSVRLLAIYGGVRAPTCKLQCATSSANTTFISGKVYCSRWSLLTQPNGTHKSLI